MKKTSPIIPILIYILFLLILFIIKPSLLFDKNGIIKNYNPKSLITLDLIYPLIALLSYYLYLIILILI